MFVVVKQGTQISGFLRSNSQLKCFSTFNFDNKFAFNNDTYGIHAIF